LENYPEGEKRELVELYVQKGIAEADATQIVEIMAKNKEAMVDVMMVEELGLHESDDSPIGKAVATFLSFATFGFLPLLSYIAEGVVDLGPNFDGFPWACLLTALTLFALGAFKTRLTGRLGSGMEMLLVDGIAAVAAFGIGKALEDLAF